MSHANRLSAALAAALLLSLAGCADPQLGALDRELANIRNNPGPTADVQLPDIPDYESARYLASEQRSPFVPRQVDEQRAAPSEGSLAPPVDRRREPLEAYDISELELVGTLTVGGQPSALVRSPEGQVHRLRAGSYLGTDHGRIVGITESSILLVELVMERGEWVERSRQVSL